MDRAEVGEVEVGQPLEGVAAGPCAGRSGRDGRAGRSGAGHNGARSLRSPRTAIPRRTSRTGLTRMNGPGSGGDDRVTVLVHEFVTGGGLAGRDLPASWAAEGSAMRRAISADFAAVPGVEVTMTLDALGSRLEALPGASRSGRCPTSRRPADRTARGRIRLYRKALIAPETGGLLADLTRAIEGAGGRTSSGPTPRRSPAGRRQAPARRPFRGDSGHPDCRRPGLGLARSRGLPTDRPRTSDRGQAGRRGRLDRHVRGHRPPGILPPGRPWACPGEAPRNPVSSSRRPAHTATSSTATAGASLIAVG